MLRPNIQNATKNKYIINIFEYDVDTNNCKDWLNHRHFEVKLVS